MLSDIRDAIAAVQVQGLRSYDTIVGDPKPDCFVVGFPDEFDPHADLEGSVDYTLPVYLFVGFQTNRRADKTMEQYLAVTGAFSLIAAIEALGTAYTCRRVRDIGPTIIGDAGIKVFGCLFDVRVLS